MRANGIRKSHYIVAGKKLKIPQKGFSTAAIAATAPAKDISYHNYRVKSGDSLWILAKRFNTTTKTIQELNRLNSTRLYAGQVLKVPNQNGAAASNGTYYVRRGDSPFAIAQRHQMPLNRLLQLNNLTAQSKIYPGQQLTVE